MAKPAKQFFSYPYLGMDTSVQKEHTCSTCSVVFKDTELQREHYKTDWHRYNLKRKVAEMPPVTLEIFEEKMSKHQEKMMVTSCEHSWA